MNSRPQSVKPPLRLGPLMTFVLSLALATMACSPEAALSDDVDLEIDFFSFGAPDNTLHSPYVRGAEFTVRAHGDDVPGDAKIIVEDEAVIVPTQSATEEKHRSFKAVAEGRTAFRVLDGRESLRRGRVAVVEANAATLYFHGDVLLGTAGPETEVQDPRVLVGGTGTFLVNYYRDDVRLYGNGVLTVEPADGSDWGSEDIQWEAGWGISRGFGAENDAIKVRVKESFFGEDRDWLQVSPKQPGEYTLQLRADGAPIGEITVIGVEEEQIEAVSVRKRSEEGLSRRSEGLVLAEAFDIDGNRIFGIEYQWDVEGAVEDGEGDLYAYLFDKDHPLTLCATYSGHESVTQIHASRGQIRSTNNAGCDISERPVDQLSLMAFLVVLGLWRRRRHSV